MATWSDYNIDLPPNAGGETRTTCPECSPTRKKQNEKCLAVNVEKGTWICHHCGWTGGLKENKQFYQPVKPAPKVYKKPKFVKSDLPENVLKWFKARGISAETLSAHKISYGKIWMPQLNKETGAVQFPYYRGEHVINIKYRDGHKNFRMAKDAERVLYGLNDINEFGTVIVEGEIDKLSLAEAGVKYCVSVPDGAPPENAKNYATKFSFLEADEDAISSVMRWIIAVDNDTPGVRLKKELIRRFGAGKCWEVKWPDGCKDANDVLVRYGKDKLVECIKSAQPTPVEGIYNVRDFANKVIDAYKHGVERGESTGWPTVDKFYTVRPGEWTLVTGIPGSGKSEWLDALMVNLSLSQGWVFGILSMENLPLERHFQKLAEKYTNLPFENKRDMERMSEMQLHSALKWGDKHFKFLLPPDDNLTIDDVIDLAKILCYRYGINGLVIDPWNELTHSYPRNVNETNYISEALGKIRRFARQHTVHVWIVAHPTKLQKDKDGSYPVPTPYDVHGSAHWRNKADNAIAIHRPHISDYTDRTVEVHIQKIRFKEIGKVGMARLRYDIVSGRYIDDIKEDSVLNYSF